MLGWLTPARRRGVEVLDDPETPDDVRAAAMADLARANAFFGGTWAVARAFRATIESLPSEPRILDVGTGTGDIAERVRALTERRGRTAWIVGTDISHALLRGARARHDGLAAGDALRLPFASRSFDVVLCSQLLHHFAEPEAEALIEELHRVARGWVIIADLRRSWLAAAGFWIASLALRFHPVTRRDGVTSVLRGFTDGELRRLVTHGTGASPRLARGVFWRVTATWRVSNA